MTGAEPGRVEGLLEDIRREALGLGFVAVGVSRPERPMFFDVLCAWLSRGKHGGMAWLGRNREVREQPERLLKGTRAIISLAYPYGPAIPATRDGFTAARYCEPLEKDYHLRLKRRAREISALIRARHPGSRSRVCVDSAPLLERSFAYASGIGFIGKNNMLIVPGHGSYLFLAEVLTTAPIPVPARGPMESLCGPCTRCVEACPTGALEGPFRLDASRCLSYLTIEDRAPVSRHTARAMGTCFFGCDRCQEVCPFNGRGGGAVCSMPSSREILSMDEERFASTLGDTALARAGLEKIKSNIRAVTDIRDSSPAGSNGTGGAHGA